MNNEIIKIACDIIFNRTGISVDSRLTDGKTQSLDIFPSNMDENDSFIIRFSPGWRSAEASFIPGKFAAPLISQMGTAKSETTSMFSALALRLGKKKCQITFRVNGMLQSPLDPVSWPTEWNRIELCIKSEFMIIDRYDNSQMVQLITDIVVPLFEMVVLLIGVEEPIEEIEGKAEGTPYQTLVTKYERKRINRDVCIQMKGTRCAACGFDYAEFYGEKGLGYIEIHHITPLSEIGPDYRINVMNDLVPLCANCHAMVHRYHPTLSIAELTSLIIRTGN